MVDDEVNAAEVVDGFHDVVDAGALGGNAKSVGFKNIASLLLGQSGAFDMVGVVGQIDLRAMVNTAFQSRFLLVAQTLK